MSSLGVSLLKHLHMFTSEALQTLPFWVFMEASLHRHSWLNPVATGNWFNLQPLSPARRKKEGCNFQLFNHAVGSSGNQALFYGDASFCGTHLCTAEYLAHLIFGCVCVCVCVCLVAQSCLTLCDTMDYSLPGSSDHGISQARILECVAISFPSWTHISYVDRQIL